MALGKDSESGYGDGETSTVLLKMSTLIVNQDTIFKVKPLQSTSLSDDEKAAVPRGEYGIASGEKVGNHYKVTLDRAIADRKDWYVFEGHVLISNSGTLVINQDTVFKLKRDPAAVAEEA